MRFVLYGANSDNLLCKKKRRGYIAYIPIYITYKYNNLFFHKFFKYIYKNMMHFDHNLINNKITEIINKIIFLHIILSVI